MIKIPNNKDVIDYLQNTAIQKLCLNCKVSMQNGLDILSKALLFKDFQHLVKFMNLLETDDGLHILWEDEEYCDIDLFDLRNGLFFSEFILRRELKIDLKDAHKIKTEIDFQFVGERRPSTGDLLFANINLVNEQSQLIRIGKQNRLMFGYPIGFYCRKYDREFYTKSGGYFKMEALWSDEVSIVFPVYFDGNENLKLYVWYIIYGIIKHNHFIIEKYVYRTLKRKLPDILQFIKDNFRPLLVYQKNYTNDFEFCGLFFPSSKMDFTNDLIFPSNNMLPINSKTWTIGTKLKYLIEKSGLTQIQLEERSGVKERTIRNTLKGKHYPDTQTIILLASAFDMTLGEFLRDIEEFVI